MILKKKIGGFSSPEPNYSPGLGQVLVERKGTFQGTHSRVAIHYNYGQPSSTEAMLSESLRHHFRWSDDEEEFSGYASFATISSVQAGFISANMADNNNDDDLLVVWRHMSKLSRSSKKH